MPTTRLIVQACLGLATLPATWALAADKPPPDKVAFYFAAHEDDWQLFMNPSAFEDVIKGAAKTVFVHVTAGDAGLRHGHARPQASVSISRAKTAPRARSASWPMPTTFPAVATRAHMAFNGHPIYRVAYRNTVSYFLRVPDGNPEGTGYERHRLPVAQAAGRAATTTCWRRSTARPSIAAGAISSPRCARSSITSAATRRALMQINVAELDRPHQSARPCRSSDDGAGRVRGGRGHGLRAAGLLRRLCQSVNLPPNLNAQQRDWKARCSR